MNNLKNIKCYMVNGLVDILYFDEELTNLPDFTIIESRTAEIFTTIDKLVLQPRNLKIQSRFSNKYRLVFFISGHVNLSNLKLANYVEIELNSGEIFYVETNEIIFGEINSLNQYKVTIPLERISNSTNNIINYLTYPEIRGRDELGAYILDTNGYDINGILQLHTLHVTRAIHFRTIINPIFSLSETKVLENERNFTKYLDRSANFNQLELLFYLKETQMLDLTAIHNNICTAKVSDGTISTNYTAIEYIMPEIKKLENAYQIYEVRIKLKYSLNEFNK